MKEMFTISEEFRRSLTEKGIELTDHQMNQSAIYYRTLAEWNEKMNPTATTGEKDVYLKHFHDSLILTSEADFTQPLSLYGAGSGAGFPSIPLKIVFPELQITTVDSLNRRVTFLSGLTRLLGIGAPLYHDRAETFEQNPHLHVLFDPVAVHAATRSNVLAGLCLPLVKQKDYLYALRIVKSEEKLTEAKQAIALLDGKFPKEEAIILPNISDRWYIIVIQKKKPTPKKYPGKPGLPNKQPIK